MRIKVEWEFDLGLNDHPDYMQFHNKFAKDNGVPLVVDLNEYFENPESVSTFTITDALSDEHGWLVNDWHVIEEVEKKETMTVNDLIEMLSKYHPTNEVLIEVNHDEVLPINESKIELGMITPEYTHATEEDRYAAAAVVIRL